MSNPYDTSSERISVLGPTLRFKGELTAEEDLVIHGQVEGTLGPAPRVTIGPEAKVKANVQATTVIVEGTVHGNLSAQSSVMVKETATVDGNIEAPAVTILEGARFNGNVSMGNAARSRTSKDDGRKSDARTDASPAKTGTNS
jgi:cytoskeletal protein CcmA (bactofilin family)